MTTQIPIVRSVIHGVVTHCLTNITPPPLPAGRWRDPYGLQRITEQTAAAFDITCTQMLAKGKADKIAWPRQIAMYLAWEYSNATLQGIADHFGKRAHGTVVRAAKRVKECMDVDERVRKQVQTIVEAL